MGRRARVWSSGVYETQLASGHDWLLSTQHLARAVLLVAT